MKYREEELKEMALVVLDARGTKQYRELVNIISFFTDLPISVVVDKIEKMAKGECDG